MVPGRSIPELYERGLAACLRRDAREVREVVLELVGALDFEYEQAARKLAGLYDRCLRQTAAGRFDRAREVFRMLLETWGAPAQVAEPRGR